MVVQKRQLLWDWTNSAGPGNPGCPDKINQVPFGGNCPISSCINWNSWVPPELKGRVPFRPMVRALDTTKGNDWAIIQSSDQPIILFFNEPERAGISPEQARDIWFSQMVPMRKNKGKKLGSPAVASDANGQAWIQKWMGYVASEMPDYLCLHYYSTNPDDATKYITDMHNKWPNVKVMVTEIACIDRNAQNVLNFTVKVCNWLDQQSWVFEYGLFDFQRKVADSFVSPAAQLMDANGNFTELGKMYVSQQPMKLPAARMMRMARSQFRPRANFAAMGAKLTSDQQAALKLHNDKRKAVGVPPMTWDPAIAKSAEDYAKHLAQIGKLEHSSGDQRPNQGENLAQVGGGPNPFADSTKMWLSEEKNYHGEPIGQGDFMSYGHFTQCVWRSSTKLGMGSAKDGQGRTWVVGRYSPVGNFLGQKPY